MCVFSETIIVQMINIKANKHLKNNIRNSPPPKYLSPQKNCPQETYKALSNEINSFVRYSNTYLVYVDPKAYFFLKQAKYK